MAFAPTGGVPFIAQLISVASRQGGAHGIQFRTALLDIGDRKRAEAALRESEERLRLALAGGQMGMWEMDLATGRAYLDGLEARLLGMEFVPREFTNEQFLQLVHREDREALRQQIRHAILVGGDCQSEFRLAPVHDGDARWIAATATVVRDGDGQPTRLLGVNFDITDADAPHAPFRIHWSRTFQQFDPVRNPGAVTDVQIDAAFGDFVSGVMQLLFDEPAA